jgi:hypothetical protein
MPHAGGRSNSSPRRCLRASWSCTCPGASPPGSCGGWMAACPFRAAPWSSATRPARWPARRRPTQTGGSRSPPWPARPARRNSNCGCSTASSANSSGCPCLCRCWPARARACCCSPARRALNCGFSAAGRWTPGSNSTRASSSAARWASAACRASRQSRWTTSTCCYWTTACGATWTAGHGSGCGRRSAKGSACCCGSARRRTRTAGARSRSLDSGSRNSSGRIPAYAWRPVPAFPRPASRVGRSASSPPTPPCSCTATWASRLRCGAPRSAVASPCGGSMTATGSPSSVTPRPMRACGAAWRRRSAAPAPRRCRRSGLITACTGAACFAASSPARRCANRPGAWFRWRSMGLRGVLASRARLARAGARGRGAAFPRACVRPCRPRGRRGAGGDARAGGRAADRRANGSDPCPGLSVAVLPGLARGDRAVLVAGAAPPARMIRGGRPGHSGAVIPWRPRRPASPAR